MIMMANSQYVFQHYHENSIWQQFSYLKTERVKGGQKISQVQSLNSLEKLSKIAIFWLSKLTFNVKTNPNLSIFFSLKNIIYFLKWPQVFLMLLLGLKESVVECATVCNKSEVILAWRLLQCNELRQFQLSIMVIFPLIRNQMLHNFYWVQQKNEWTGQEEPKNISSLFTLKSNGFDFRSW